MLITQRIKVIIYIQLTFLLKILIIFALLIKNYFYTLFNYFVYCILKQKPINLDIKKFIFNLLNHNKIKILILNNLSYLLFFLFLKDLYLYNKIFFIILCLFIFFFQSQFFNFYFIFFRFNRRTKYIFCIFGTLTYFISI